MENTELNTIGQQDELVVNYTSKDQPKDLAALYKKDNLRGGHVIMLDKTEQTRDKALDALKAWPSGLQIGGGINHENAQYYIQKGASHVIVTSSVFKDGQIDFEQLNKLVESVGTSKVVLDLSCRKKPDGDYYVVTNKWQKYTDFKISKEQVKLLEQHCDEFLVHGVSVEGKKEGIEQELVQILADICTIPVTYAGGVQNMDDLNLFAKIGQGKVNVTVGSALDIFGGDLKYEEVVHWHKQQNVKA